jgi:hypothetical protein
MADRGTLKSQRKLGNHRWREWLFGLAFGLGKVTLSLRRGEKSSNPLRNYAVCAFMVGALGVGGSGSEAGCSAVSI